VRYRYCAAVLLLLLLIVGCTPMPRFTNPPGNAPLEKPRETEEQPKPLEKPVPTLSRIDINKMDHIIAGYMATPYERGGSGVLGLDCSGFVYVVYRDYDGTRLPLTVQTLYRLDDRVDQDDLSYGDLVFFRTDGRKVTHVGIYIGQSKFVHASESRGVVIDDMSSDTFASEYAGARRIK
jgi:murein DD-endopeptidase / murein LD-carboxypeptidase